jgi:GNAT superfamily N-acetyltransferase
MITISASLITMPTSLSELPIRRLSLGDLPSCLDLAENRDWPREEALWRLLLTAGTVHGIDDPRGHGLAATAGVTSYGADAPELGAVGMVLVAKEHGRRGLGLRLMTHAMREAGPVPLALYATPSGLPLYERLGFTVVGECATLRGTLRSPAPGASQRIVIRPAQADDLPAVIDLDGEAFGVDRTLMITRLPAFTDRLVVAEHGSALTGYAAARRTTDAYVIGPVIARDAETAEALVQALGARPPRPLRIEVDSRNEELLSHLKEQGLDVTRVSAAMVYGAPALPGDPSLRFAPLTLATW